MTRHHIPSSCVPSMGVIHTATRMQSAPRPRISAAGNPELPVSQMPPEDPYLAQTFHGIFLTRFPKCYIIFGCAGARGVNISFIRGLCKCSAEEHGVNSASEFGSSAGKQTRHRHASRIGEEGFKENIQHLRVPKKTRSLKTAKTLSLLGSLPGFEGWAPILGDLAASASSLSGGGHGHACL